METASFDVLVVGSGAGGLATAISAHHFGCRVLVVEKEANFGGTTARSGGWLWVPGNPLAGREGAVDSIERARTYIAGESGNHFDAARVDAFLANAGKMVAFFEANTEVKFNFTGEDRAGDDGKTGALQSAMTRLTAIPTQTVHPCPRHPSPPRKSAVR